MLLSFLASITAAAAVAAVKFSDPQYVLSPSFNIHAAPQVRKYNFAITNVTDHGPDGYQRNMIAINGQFPGPLIEANSHDTISVTVQNELMESTTVHWHGLYQNGTNWEDGVTGVTQCPIAAGASYTYTFKLNGQFGSYWYHSHSKLQMADGLYGPLIIHDAKDPLVRGKDFNNEIVVLLGDWFHNTSALILSELESPTGYNGSFASPSPNSALMSGVSSTFNCTGLPKSDHTPCKSPAPIEYAVDAGSKTRFRLINAASHALFRFEADGHLLNHVEADGTGIQGPTDLQRVTVAAGQRASVIMTVSASDAGKTFWIRGGMDPTNWGWQAGNLDRIVKGVIRVRGKNGQLPGGLPTTSDWPSPAGVDPYSAGAFDPPATTMVPLIAEDVPSVVKGRKRFLTQANLTVIPPAFYVNDVSYLAHPWQPFIQDYQPGHPGTIDPTRIGYLTFPTDDWYDMVVVNGDPFAHPYHLHSIDMHIVAEGHGDPTNEELDALTYNTKNPLRRDTISVAANSYFVARLHTNIPGVWMMHCHIGWHLAVGFAGAIVVQPDAISKFKIPQANLDLCKAAPAGNTTETEPGLKVRQAKWSRSFQRW